MIHRDKLIHQATRGTQHRDLTLRAETSTDDGTITGIGVPYGVTTDLIPGMLRETIAPGAVHVDEDAGVHLFYRHDEVIGRVIDHHDEDDGWHITAQVSDTTLGRDALTLTRDGVIKRLSIGFWPEEFDEAEDDDGALHITVTRAKVVEVSLVPHPAYDGAQITSVRHRHESPEEDPMPDTATPTSPAAAAATRADLDGLRTEFRETLTDELRRLQLGTRDDEGPAAPTFRSYGHYVKALASGDEAAVRAFTGHTTGDAIVKDAWLGGLYELMKSRFKIVDLFTHTQDLPAEGMGVEFGKVSANTIKVAEQVNEGDDLVYGKISLTTENARIKTFGGWTDFSRQHIERASEDALSLAFEALALEYANSIEGYARATLGAAVTAAPTTLYSGKALGSMAYGDYIDLLIDLTVHLDDVNRTNGGLLVGRDVYKAMAATDKGDPMLRVNGSNDDHLGELNISSLDASLDGVRITLHPGWTTEAIAFDPRALKTKEAPGAPMRLQDENIVNLTQQYSVYGYATSFVQLPDGIVPFNFGAEPSGA